MSEIDYLVLYLGTGSKGSLKFFVLEKFRKKDTRASFRNYQGWKGKEPTVRRAKRVDEVVQDGAGKVAGARLFKALLVGAKRVH
jgi:hypothetical protein